MKSIVINSFALVAAAVLIWAFFWVVSWVVFS